MAYEKFIKKDGKLYGPYIYHSKRIDGKVVSEYHGSGKPDYKKFLIVAFGVFLLAIFIYLYLNSCLKLYVEVFPTDLNNLK